MTTENTTSEGSEIEAPILAAAPPILGLEVPSDLDPEPPPPPDSKAESTRLDRLKRASAAKREETRAPAPPTSKDMAAINLAEDASIRTMLEYLGSNGAFEVIVTRKEPEEVTDPATGRRIKTAGMLKKYAETIDEDVIKKRHGGGKYELKIMRSTGRGEQKVHFKQRTIEIAGEVNLDDPALQRIGTPVAATGQQQTVAAPESDKVATQALGMAERMMDKMASHKQPEPDHSPYKMMVDTLQRELDATRTQMREMQHRYEERAAQPQNPVENRLLDKLIDQDSARMLAMRAQHESEIRMLKDQQADEIKRLNDRFDRMLESQKQSFEREISSLRTTHDIVKVTLASSQDTSKEVLQGQIKSLERQLDAKDKELAALRDKKELSPLDQIRQLKELKDIVADDDDDDDDDKGVIGQIMNKVPDAIGAIGSMMGKGPQQQAQQALPAARQAPPRAQLLRGPDGKRYLSRNGQLVEIAPKQIQNEAGTQVPIPDIAPERLAMLRNLLEAAFQNGTTPEAAAQTARANMAGQEEIFQAVRALGGVDVFLSKVANLPSDSPLATQLGKNWLRKFSKALVGE